MQKKFDSLDKVELKEIEFTLDELNDSLLFVTTLVEKDKNISLHLSQLEEKKSKLKLQLNLIVFDKEVSKEKLNNIIESINQILKDIQYQEELLSYIEKYKLYIDAKMKFDEWHDKNFNLSNEYNSIEKEYNSMKIFKTKILEAESLCLIRILSEINTHFQLYIDLFFPNDLMIVNLSPFRELKGSEDKKSQISLKIIYKSSELDISQLSGGERDRLEMAFVFVLCDIINSPLILLDESISSLDSETSDLILRQLKSLNRIDRSILCIAHQTTSGIFDNILNVENI